MSKEPFNFNFPFVNMMPEDMGDPNLILNSMKMMSQAWQKFANMAPQATSMAIDPNELDKRIEELKAVESWLKLNLSMLSSSIHSLEIQKANLQNFNSFMDMMSEPLRASQAAATKATERSFAEAAAAKEQAQKEAQEQQASPAVDEAHAETTAPDPADTDSEAQDNQTGTIESSLANTGAMMQEQALNWFNLLGDQFKNIVASVAASTPGDVVEKARAEDKEQSDTSAGTSKSGRAATKRTTAAKKTAAKKVATKRARKTATKEATQSGTRTVAKKATKRAVAKKLTTDKRTE